MEYIVTHTMQLQLYPFKKFETTNINFNKEWLFSTLGVYWQQNIVNETRVLNATAHTMLLRSNYFSSTYHSARVKTSQYGWCQIMLL